MSPDEQRKNAETELRQRGEEWIAAMEVMGRDHLALTIGKLLASERFYFEKTAAMNDTYRALERQFNDLITR